MIKEKIRCSLDIEEEVLHYIASKEDSNIRDLEGALKKVIASAQLKIPFPPSIRRSPGGALKDFLWNRWSKPSRPLVVRCVCEYYDISEDDIYSKRKTGKSPFPAGGPVSLKHLNRLHQ